MSTRPSPSIPSIWSSLAAPATSRGKLMPSLYYRDATADPGEARITGTSRSELPDAYAKEIRRRSASTCRPATSTRKPAALPRPSITSRRREVTRGLEHWRGAAANPGRVRVFAGNGTDLSGRCARAAREDGAHHGEGPRRPRKPIGRDLASAEPTTLRRLGVRGRADPSHRSPSRQRSRAEPHGAALRQLAVRAARAGPHQPHGTPCPSVSASKDAVATTIKSARCATWCRTTSCLPPRCDGAANAFNAAGVRDEAEGAARAEVLHPRGRRAQDRARTVPGGRASNGGAVPGYPGDRQRH